MGTLLGCKHGQSQGQAVHSKMLGRSYLQPEKEKKILITDGFFEKFK